VKPYQKLYLADVLRANRERLEAVIEDLVSSGSPIGEHEVRILLDAKESQRGVEDALRYDAIAGGAPRLRHGVQRARGLSRPKIGMLRHYAPRPLVLPAAYFATALPACPPSISMVTPSFQHGRFLGRTILSVAAQNYPSLEYVVQDGGSSDDTLDVLHRFEAELARWRSEPDSGQADAINRGFADTTGDVMGWLNSDDLLLPGALAHVGRYFAQHPEVDVVYGNRIMIDENDDQIGAWILPAHDDEALTLADYVPQETLFWRRRIWDAAGGYVDASFRYAMDWELLLRFRSAGATMTRLPRFLGAFRIHADQKTTALDDVGAAETRRLRERVHGRDVPLAEVNARLKGYYTRHVVAHLQQRALDRLPIQRARFALGSETAVRAAQPGGAAHEQDEAQATPWT
jgi:GT2 family glycosyltransferase